MKKRSSKTNRKKKTLGFNLIKPSHLGKLSAFIMIVILFFCSLNLNPPQPRLFSYMPAKFISGPNIFLYFYSFTVDVLMPNFQRQVVGESRGRGRNENMIFLVVGLGGEISQKKLSLAFCLLS